MAPTFRSFARRSSWQPQKTRDTPAFFAAVAKVLNSKGQLSSMPDTELKSTIRKTMAVAPCRCCRSAARKAGWTAAKKRTPWKESNRTAPRTCATSGALRVPQMACEATRPASTSRRIGAVSAISWMKRVKERIQPPAMPVSMPKKTEMSRVRQTTVYSLPLRER